MRLFWAGSGPAPRRRRCLASPAPCRPARFTPPPGRRFPAPATCSSATAAPGNRCWAIRRRTGGSCSDRAARPPPRCMSGARRSSAMKAWPVPRRPKARCAIPARPTPGNSATAVPGRRLHPAGRRAGRTVRCSSTIAALSAAIRILYSTRAAIWRSARARCPAPSNWMSPAISARRNIATRTARTASWPPMSARAAGCGPTAEAAISSTTHLSAASVSAMYRGSPRRTSSVSRTSTISAMSTFPARQPARSCSTVAGTGFLAVSAPARPGRTAKSSSTTAAHSGHQIPSN